MTSNSTAMPNGLDEALMPLPSAHSFCDHPSWKRTCLRAIAGPLEPAARSGVGRLAVVAAGTSLGGPTRTALRSGTAGSSAGGRTATGANAPSSSSCC